MRREGVSKRQVQSNLAAARISRSDLLVVPLGKSMFSDRIRHDRTGNDACFDQMLGINIYGLFLGLQRAGAEIIR